MRRRNILLRYTLILFALALTFWALAVAEPILVPLMVGLLLALLLLPPCRTLEAIGLPRWLTALLSIVIVIAVIGLLAFFLATQFAVVSDDLPSLAEELESAAGRAERWMQQRFGLPRRNGDATVSGAVQNAFRAGSDLLSRVVSATTDVVAFLVLTPLSLFFFLYYRSFLRSFLFRAFPARAHRTVARVIGRVQSVGVRYLSGLLMVMGILMVLNTAGLLVFRVRYAVFWGVLSSLLTIIPFFGVILGALFPILFTLLTKDSLLITFGVAAWYTAVQQVEGDLITPNVVGGQVSINPFAAILALVIGGELWGAAGLVLAIPYLAILKVVLDEVEPLAPYGYLLGNPRAGGRGRWLRPPLEWLRRRLGR